MHPRLLSHSQMYSPDHDSVLNFAPNLMWDLSLPGPSKMRQIRERNFTVINSSMCIFLWQSVVSPNAHLFHKIFRRSADTTGWISATQSTSKIKKTSSHNLWPLGGILRDVDFIILNIFLKKSLNWGSLINTAHYVIFFKMYSVHQLCALRGPIQHYLSSTPTF